MKGKKLLLVDGHGLAFRAFYALPELTAPDGTPTNAVVGFFNMFQKVREEWKPDMCGVVFDAPGPTFRHEAYEDYKAGRKPTPPEFKVQLPLIFELLSLLGIPVVVRQGVEADDVLASTACTAAAEHLETLILSSDKDILQILGPGLSVLRPGKGITSFRRVDERSFVEEYGFPPSAMTDYLALLGDTADNVPGVPGVGEKTAKALLAQYGSLDGIYDRLESLKPGLRKKFEENREQAYRSRELVTLLCDTKEDLRDFLPGEVDREGFLERCKSLGLQKIAGKMISGEGREQVAAPAGELLSRGSGGEKRSIPSWVFIPVIIGKYPVSLSLEEFYLAGPDGETAGKISEEALSALAGRGKGKVLLPDYKEAAACLGSSFLPPSSVLDFKTAHYLLHPDGGVHHPEGLFTEYASLSPAEKGRFLTVRFEELAGEIADHEGLSTLMEQTDLPLIPVLVDMERHGIGCSIPAFSALETDLSSRLKGIEEEITARGGEKINLNSPKQVAWLLFEKLGLPAGKTTKTGYSTDISVLEGLSSMGRPYDEVPNLLIEYRELSKMLSGFVQPLVKAAREGDGIIHGVFEPAVTGTGRLSSRDPNLQNLPSFGEWSGRIKKGLLPTGEGNVFVAADYSQIELRVLAHLCGDKRLLDAFAQGRDIHTETASWVFSTDPALVTPELRRVAKMINFGLLYGMSSFGLAQRLGIGRREASEIIRRYFEALPGVKDYLEKSYDDARKRGFARTLAGRIRPLAEVSVSPRDRDALRRVAVNTPIQGTAADIARKAMVDFAAAFPSSGTVRLVLQVHDSLVCECPSGEAEDVKRSLEGIMERAADLAVPLKVESKTGSSLAEV
ncbi:DNA polymerase [Aminivibrio sp.]|uniref:DNA polymerase n=1 Tax=Aminivibrio sp. TaxID=1872489 RepID=UPI001A500DDC|nr:DNA polymerase [Aminivibrio sp.]MBL3539564.1 DNA polymerase I [Aminivibrio sp.]MDK2958430.1 polymerase [Synergistaceae bacterium]